MEALKLALTLYWQFMFEHMLVGFFLTIIVWAIGANMIVRLVALFAPRRRRPVAPPS